MLISPVRAREIPELMRLSKCTLGSLFSKYSQKTLQMLPEGEVCVFLGEFEALFPRCHYVQYRLIVVCDISRVYMVIGLTLCIAKSGCGIWLMLIQYVIIFFEGNFNKHASLSNTTTPCVLTFIMHDEFNSVAHVLF